MITSESNPARLYRSPLDETINRGPPCVRVQKDPTCSLKILWSMSECGGLGKHQNNPACTQSVRVFKVLRFTQTVSLRKKKKTNNDTLDFRVMLMLPERHTHAQERVHVCLFVCLFADLFFMPSCVSALPYHADYVYSPISMKSGTCIG